jgi:hypothetical protein
MRGGLHEKPTSNRPCFFKENIRFSIFLVKKNVSALPTSRVAKKPSASLLANGVLPNNLHGDFVFLLIFGKLFKSLCQHKFCATGRCDVVSAELQYSL